MEPARKRVRFQENVIHIPAKQQESKNKRTPEEQRRELEVLHRLLLDEIIATVWELEEREKFRKIQETYARPLL